MRSKALVAVVALACAAAVVWWAVPGSAKDEPASRAAFSVAGDGSLPTARPKIRDARDPLSADEIGYAIGIATADPGLPEATDVRGAAAWEVLSVDVPDDDVDAVARRAVVTLYDYTNDTTHTQLVDLTRGRVTESRSATSVRQPPAANETEVAVAIALAAEPALAFTADFEATEGVPLVSAEQVSTVAGGWTHDEAHEGHGGEAVHECGRRRCVQLLIATRSGRYLDTSDFVVDLSHRVVVRLAGEH